MKTLTTLFMILMLAFTVHAQDDDIPLDGNAKEKIKAARIAYITDQLELTPEEAEKFWPIYREFSEKRLQLRKQYREAKKNPDPAKTQEQNDKDLVDLDFKLKQNELDLEKDYSGRLLKIISAQKLRTLPEAERRFRQMIIDQIQRRQLQQERRDQIRERSQQRFQQRNN